MTEREKSAILAIAIHAAFADGAPADVFRQPDVVASYTGRVTDA